MKKKIEEILVTILEILKIKLETNIAMKNEIWKDGYKQGYKDASQIYKIKKSLF